MVFSKVSLNSANFSCSVFLFLSCSVIVWTSDSSSLICRWLRLIRVLFWEMSWLSLVISLDSWVKWRSLSVSNFIVSSRSLKPFLSSFALSWTSAILFTRNSSSISWVQVGHTVFSVKNLCSLVMVDTLLDNLPFRLFSFFNLDPAPVTFSCSFRRSSTLLSISWLCYRWVSASTVKDFILPSLSDIFFLLRFSNSSIKFSCISTLSLRDSFLSSNVFICSLSSVSYTHLTLPTKA